MKWAQSNYTDKTPKPKKPDTRLYYSASGTIGDAYINVCRIYNIQKENKIRIYHETRHQFWKGLIERVYYLHPNVWVSVQRKSEKIDGIRNIERLKPVWFPEFEFASAKERFNLPDEYVAICMKSGRPSQKFRRIKPDIIDEIISGFKHVIIVGDDTPDPYKPDNVIDLRGKTTLWEAFWIMKHAREAFAFQGVMAFVALSQKVPTTVFIKKDEDKVAVKGNILLTPWKQYCKEVKQT